MNKALGVQLVLYSLLLAGFSYVAYRLAPGSAEATLTTSLIGGALCLFWGVWAICGSRRKIWSMLTLVPVAFLLLARTVIGWSGGTTAVPRHEGFATITTLLFLLSLAMLIRIAYAGVLGEGPAADRTSAGRGPSGLGGGLEPGIHGGKRA